MPGDLGLTKQEVHLVKLHEAGEHTTAELSATNRCRRVSGHVFVDETKHRGYLLVAGVVLPEDLAAMRK